MTLNDENGNGDNEARISSLKSMTKLPTLLVLTFWRTCIVLFPQPCLLSWMRTKHIKKIKKNPTIHHLCYASMVLHIPHIRQPCPNVMKQIWPQKLGKLYTYNFGILFIILSSLTTGNFSNFSCSNWHEGVRQPVHVHKFWLQCLHHWILDGIRCIMPASPIERGT